MVIIDWRVGPVHVYHKHGRRRDYVPRTTHVPADHPVPDCPTYLLVSHPQLTDEERGRALHWLRDRWGEAMALTFLLGLGGFSLYFVGFLGTDGAAVLPASAAAAASVGLLWLLSARRAMTRIRAENPALAHLQRRGDLVAVVPLSDPDVIRHATNAQADLMLDPAGFGSSQHHAVWAWARSQVEEQVRAGRVVVW